MLVDLLVGRDQVLNSVEAQLDAVRYGTAARALVITGAAGTGRSSALQVAAARAARDGWAVGVASIGAQDNLAAALDRALELALRQCPPGAGFARRLFPAPLARMGQPYCRLPSPDWAPAPDALSYRPAVLRLRSPYLSDSGRLH